ncbi:MAG: ATP-binding protein [Eubacteriales bacterium]|nr:ATP-binding protein [Eubacteriales bacterium]
MTAQQIRRTLQRTFVRTLRRPFRDAVQQYALVQPGDQIAVCISGGKDSMLLALLLQDLQRTMDIGLRFVAMDPGYTPAVRAQLLDNAALLELPLEVFRTDVLRIAERHAAAHPCFLCAKLRRGHLYAQAQARGCNKIALGHHYDDAIETVLLGLLYGGQVQAMLPRVQAKNYRGMELIRPLYHVREAQVQAWVEHCGLTFAACDCPAKTIEGGTHRERVKALIASLAAADPQVEANLFHALTNVDTAKLLGWRDAAGRHSFLDTF